jgi:pimeloyl-ACP methyl ester carboxylesterase
MPHARAGDGVRLYYEEAGKGTPVLFLHEFAGDHRSWEPQLRAFARRYRCIAYNARGYPPSDVPAEVESYSQERAADDAIAVLDHLGIDRAHIVGLSMGGFATLQVGLRHPGRALSLVAAGCGYGAEPEKEATFRAENEVTARSFDERGAEATAESYAVGPARVQYLNKDPRGWSEFKARLAEHSALGSALTLRGVQMRRPSLYSLRDRLAALEMPVLIVTGDEDEGCLDVDLMLKRTIATAGLVVLPRTGHACNLEEPELFNRFVLDFLAAADAGRWERRDPRAVVGGLTGMRSEGRP